MPTGNDRNICSGGQRDIGNAREAFVTPIDVQIFQFQPCQPCFEISGTRYREIDTCIAESGCVAIRIAKRKCTVFCHMPRPASCEARTRVENEINIFFSQPREFPVAETLWGPPGPGRGQSPAPWNCRWRVRF